MTTTVRLSEELVRSATIYANANYRSANKQIEYWAMLGRCAEDNPDLTLDFIKECLLAKEEIKQGNVTKFKFRNK